MVNKYVGVTIFTTQANITVMNLRRWLFIDSKQDGSGDY